MSNQPNKKVFLFFLSMHTLFLLMLLFIVSYLTYADPTKNPKAWYYQISSDYPYAPSQYPNIIHELEIGATEGYTEPKYWLGYLYAHGYGVETSRSQAEKWLTCKNSYRYCIPGELEFFIGIGFLDKKSIQRETVKEMYDNALYWISLSAEKGYPKAIQWIDFNKKAGVIDALTHKNDQLIIQETPYDAQKSPCYSR